LLPEFRIVRSMRRTTVCIRITHDGAVMIAAPAGLPRTHIEQLVQDKAAWIRERLRRHEVMRAQCGPGTYQDGDPLFYLGRRLRLQLTTDTGHPVLLRRGSIRVPVPACLREENRKQHIIRMLSTWYQARALRHVQWQGAHIAGNLGVRPACVGIKSYRSRWGSCHADGRIYFNWRIIQAPQKVIRYVVVHELCHLIHHNHSRAFWVQVATVMPDYRQAKGWLRTNGAMLAMAAPG